MSIRLKTKKLIYAGLAGAAITIALFSICGYFFYNHVKKNEIETIRKYEEELNYLKSTADISETVYALNQDVEKGALITEEMLTPTQVSPAAKSEDIVELPNLKRKDKYVLYAKTDLKANTVLVKSMVYEEENITNDVREAEYSFIEIPSNVAKDDYVDIRIVFPTGDDFIVLPKKKVKDLYGITMWMNVNEREILTVQSAVVDAFLNQARIYAIAYEDAEFQSKPIMTYPVKENIKQLIIESPNVVDIAAMRLELQNRERLESHLNMLAQEDKDRVRSGAEATNSKREEANRKIREEQEMEAERLRLEERLNEVNQNYEAQQSLIGGGKK